MQLFSSGEQGRRGENDTERVEMGVKGVKNSFYLFRARAAETRATRRNTAEILLSNKQSMRNSPIKTLNLRRRSSGASQPDCREILVKIVFVSSYLRV